MNLEIIAVEIGDQIIKPRHVHPCHAKNVIDYLHP